MKEKSILSMSIITFLKTYSEKCIPKHSELVRKALYNKDRLNSILFGEITYAKDFAKWRKIPISIEETYFGSSMDKLL
jgi:hypothetical protein